MAFKTKGEILYGELLNFFSDQAAWSSVLLLLGATGRGEEFVEFFQEVSAIQTCGRLIAFGVGLSKQSAVGSPEFQHALKQYATGTIVTTNIKFRERVIRLTTEATHSAREEINDSNRKRLRREYKEDGAPCYICGIALDYSNDAVSQSYTLDHVWPRVYGGDSDPDNLLPACAICNNERKTNFATWALPAVQSLIIGANSSPQRMLEIGGTLKFAIHQFSALKLARARDLSLRDAFLRIGAWREPSPSDVDDIHDFFNLASGTMELRK